MRKSTFLKHINQLSLEDLRDEISVLYDKLEGVKKFYKMELGNPKDKEKHYTAAKKLISSKFATKSYRKPRRPRIQKINSILSALKKEALFDFEMIDIYLFTAEKGMDFMHEYEFISEPLFNNIVKCYEKAAMLMINNLMESEFNPRFVLLLSKSRYYKSLHIELNGIYSGAAS